MAGPCETWTTDEEVAECCGGGSDAEEYATANRAASEVLYALVPRYSVCEVSVRPCTGVCGVGWPVGYSTYLWFGDEWRDGSGASRSCGCHPLSSIPLAGHAVEIVEVLIDGNVVDPATYRLDEHRALVRMRDADGDRQFWPGCQEIDSPSTEPGTFEITYRAGVEPTEIAKLAAKELACAIHTTVCAGAAGGDGDLEDCPLPTNVVEVQRQGITIKLDALRSFGFSKDRGWSTGLPLVDVFLNAANPTGKRKRRASVWSPDLERFPRPVGDVLSS